MSGKLGVVFGRVLFALLLTAHVSACGRVSYASVHDASGSSEPLDAGIDASEDTGPGRMDSGADGAAVDGGIDAAARDAGIDAGARDAGSDAGAADAGAAATVGCADGEREGFTVLSSYPNIAGCSGGFSIAGVATATPAACARASGDDSANPSGVGCNIADLCALGWHVCASPAEVTAKSPTGCTGATRAGDPDLVFVQRTSGPSFAECGVGVNDIFGCGNHMFTLTAAPSCAPLDDVISWFDVTTALPWNMGGSPGEMEALDVTKGGPALGGALCCSD